MYCVPSGIEHIQHFCLVVLTPTHSTCLALPHVQLKPQRVRVEAQAKTNLSNAAFIMI
jgi:hypothetical protein